GANELDLLLFGRKAIEHFQKKAWPAIYHRIDWGGKIPFHEVSVFAHTVINKFLTGIYDEVWLIYTDYISVMRREVIVQKFLNIDPPEEDKNTALANFIFEPDQESILNAILPRYCVTMMQTALNEAYASELAARIVAMQTASQNSEQLIHDLTLTRNKI